MSTQHEVLGNYDYEWAAKEKLRPKNQHEPRLLGRVARLLFEETTIGKIKGAVEGMAAWWKQKRAEEKADRAYKGSLAEIKHTIVPLEEEYHIPEAQVDPAYMQPIKSHQYGEHHLYRSVHARETAEGPGSIDDEMAEVMQTAVDRARQHLGHVATSQEDNEPAIPRQREVLSGEVLPAAAPAPQSETSGEMSDEALLARLEAAYSQPAVIPPHERIRGRHRAPGQRRLPRLPIIRHRDQDNLTGTRGK